MSDDRQMAKLVRARRRFRRWSLIGATIMGGMYWHSELRYKSWMPRSEMLVPFRRVTSRWFGDMMSHDFGPRINKFIIQTFGKTYGVNFNEIDPQFLDEHNENCTVQQFFTRPLARGVRSINAPNGDLVVPADSVFSAGGPVTNGQLESIKGANFDKDDFWKVRAFDPSDGHALDDSQLYYSVFYLAPGDYHRFHSPCDWDVYARVHQPGDMYTVGLRAVMKDPEIFVENERVNLLGKWKHGFMGYSAVGARNVGSMRLTFEPELRTNNANEPTTEAKAVVLDPVVGDTTSGGSIMQRFAQRLASYAPQMALSAANYRLYSQPPSKDQAGSAPTPSTSTIDLRDAPSPWYQEDGLLQLSAGTEVGTFRMGSTIVMCWQVPPGHKFIFDPDVGSTVRVGQVLGSVVPSNTEDASAE